ncbi:elongation factor G [Photobacterium sp.]|uniref:elongation factor G n=1 Tax=Photobacterium sp. TaxID=660 RepID=UPI00299DD025|nr:elongation factor G [Photobacterium sp.]MDX1303446.1 elongation factor G [Photobacterium sp.]
MSVALIRNIAFAGQSGSGKTSLVERLLFESGAIKTLGELPRGTTVTDFDRQSIDYQHSVEATPVNFCWQKNQFNLIDTPGAGDLIGRAMSIYPAIETIALVVDATAGPASLSDQLFQMAHDHKKCRLIIINKIDADGINLHALLAQLKERYGPQCLPINLPDPGGHEVVDCYFKPDPDEPTLFSTVEEAHDALIDQVIEVDEELMEVYLEQGQDLSPQQLHAPFEAVLRDGQLIPVCFVSAQSGAGIRQLLRIMSELIPSPLESNPPLFYSGDKPITVSLSEEDHVVGHVFKVSIDPYMGRMAFVRIFQGVLTPDSQLYIDDGKTSFKVGHLYQVQGKLRREIQRAASGDICAIAKIDELQFDSVVHNSHDEDGLHLASLNLPAPMYSLVVHPARRGDEQKLSDVLKKLTSEDPSLQVTHRVRVNETLLTGIGEFHLKIALEKMQQQYKLNVQTSAPSIDYRETITRPAEAHHRHKKQTGGAGQFGEVYLKVNPLSRGEGFKFVNKVVGGAIPGQFIPAVEKGVRQVLEEGAIAGYPLQDLEVIVYDGKHHSVDSKEIAFVSAGRKAFLEAVKQADPIILEPIVDIKILTPSDCIGDISGDLSSRRGMINDSQPESQDRTLIQAKAPLTQLQDYSQRIKSLTRGEGSFSLSLSHFEPVPTPLQQQLTEAYRESDSA